MLFYLQKMSMAFVVSVYVACHERDVLKAVEYGETVLFFYGGKKLFHVGQSLFGRDTLYNAFFVADHYILSVQGFFFEHASLGQCKPIIQFFCKILYFFI